MRYFHDSERNKWEINLTLKTAKRVYDALNVDLFQPVRFDENGRTLSERLMNDDLLLGEVVIALIGEQIEARKMTCDEVREAIGAAQFPEIQEAFFEEYSDFFKLRQKQFLADAIRRDFEKIKEEIAENNVKIRLLVSGETSNASPPSPDSAPTTAT